MASGIEIKPRDAVDRTFHVTTRGVGKLRPFFAEIEKREMVERFKFYLSRAPYTDRSRRAYEKLFDEVALLAYCILDNHLHTVVHQRTADGMRRLFTRVLASYGKYYNRKHRRKGPLFDARYAAQPIESTDHAKFAIAYTHLNDPILQLDNPHSSHRYYMAGTSPDWLDVEAGLAVFGGVDAYRDFMNRVGPRIVATKLKRHGVDPKAHPYRPI